MVELKIKSSDINKRKIVLIIGIIIFILFIMFVVLSQKNLTRHGILLKGKTLEWAIGAKMSMDLKYEFYFNGKRLIGNNSFKDFQGNTDFENKYFPVMYDPKLGSSQLLVEPADFKRFNLPFPDSLKWVLPYISN